MKESSFTQTLYEKYIPQQLSSREDKKTSAPIAWDGVIFPFAILIGSILITLLILGIENVGMWHVKK